MQRTIDFFKKIWKYLFVLLLSLPARLLEDRIVGGLNRFLV